MKDKFVNIVIDKNEGSRFLISEDNSIDTVNLSNDKQISIARINIKDDVTTVCLYENGESKGTISLNIGTKQVKIDSNSNKIIYVDKDNDGNGTLRRSKKKSFEWYKKVIASNGENIE